MKIKAFNRRLNDASAKKLREKVAELENELKNARETQKAIKNNEFRMLSLLYFLKNDSTTKYQYDYIRELQDIIKKIINTITSKEETKE